MKVLHEFNVFFPVFQKLFVKQFREKSSPMTPTAAVLENKGGDSGKENKEMSGGLKNGNTETVMEVVVVNGSSNHHYTPPNSEDEHSDVSRSVSTAGSCGISICTDSISCPSSVSNTPLSRYVTVDAVNVN